MFFVQQYWQTKTRHDQTILLSLSTSYYRCRIETEYTNRQKRLGKRHKEHMLKLLLYSTDVFCCPSLELCVAATLCPERCYLQIYVVVKYQAKLFCSEREKIHNNCCTLNRKVDDVECYTQFAQAFSIDCISFLALISITMNGYLTKTRLYQIS